MKTYDEQTGGMDSAPQSHANMRKHPIAEMYEKSYMIGENHANVGKTALATPEVFVDTYFSDEEFQYISVEWQVTKRELYEVYKTGYRNMNSHLQSRGI